MLTFRVELEPSSLTMEADALFCSAQYCRALPLYQQHINEIHQQTAASSLRLLWSARSYRMLAKCYRYMGQWDYALPALLDALHCIDESRHTDTFRTADSDSDSTGSVAVQLEQHIHHMLADTYSVLAEQQKSNISNPLRLSQCTLPLPRRRSTRHTTTGCRTAAGTGRRMRAAVDASVAVQVSLGCVYRLMGRQAQQELRHKRLSTQPLNLTSPEEIGIATAARS